MRLLGIGKEELGAIGVGAVVRHGNHSSYIMLKSEEHKTIPVKEDSSKNNQIKQLAVGFTHF